MIVLVELDVSEGCCYSFVVREFLTLPLRWLANLDPPMSLMVVDDWMAAGLLPFQLTYFASVDPLRLRMDVR